MKLNKKRHITSDDHVRLALAKSDRYRRSVVRKLKKEPTHVQAHLVFAKAKPNTEKTKRAFTSPPPPERANTKYLISKHLFLYSELLFTFDKQL